MGGRGREREGRGNTEKGEKRKIEQKQVQSECTATTSSTVCSERAAWSGRK